MTRPLFEIMPDLLALNELFEAEGGELGSPEIEAAFVEWTTTLASEEGVKLDGYCGLIRTLEGEEAVAKAEAEQFAMKARARANRVKWLKERMRQYLEMTGRSKAGTATGRTIAIQANGGKQPLFINPTTDPKTLPVEYQRVRVEVDTDAVREALDGGADLPFAKLESRGSHLRIR